MTDLLQAAKEVIRQISVEHLSENAVESLRQAINEAENAKQEPVGYWQGTFNTEGGAILYEVPQASAFGYRYPNHPVYAAPQPVKLEISEEAFNWIDANAPMFVREALAGVDMSPTEQAEQDLDTCPGCGGVADNGHDREFPPNPYYCTKCTEQAEQEPVKIFFNLALRKMWSGTEIQSWIDSLPPLYAAPVRTKDLTDGELTAIWERNAGDWLACFRAVIAADRELNK